VPQRITEYLTQQTLSLDVGKMVTGKSDMVSVWVAYRWWKNKFGLDPATTGFNGTLESTARTGVPFGGAALLVALSQSTVKKFVAVLPHVEVRVVQHVLRRRARRPDWCR